ncbi:MAG TPA: glycine betaine ABC transporter substrate-binding protein [Ilumatobacter sp.]|nr:glycine betaine ABC transporter substrate-binding protein [Ilumatobacter sp.]
MKNLREHRMLAASVATLALVAAACGGDDDDGAADTPPPPAETTVPDGAPDTGGEQPGGDPAECTTALGPDASVSSLADLDFSGLTVNVGSKDFVEQFVLGQLLIVALEAGGATTVDNVNLGGTNVNRDALLNGEIDAYFEYNGTGWTVHLGNDDPSFDSTELTNDTCVADLAENGIRWLGVSPFNNTYGFATSGDSPAAGVDLQGMADYIADNPDAVVCMEVEYPNRSDGLVLFEEHTGFVIPDGQIEILDSGVIYDETASGNCTFGEIFTTDGRIVSLGLDVVEDPGVHIIYNVSLTIGDDLYQQAPEAWQAVADTILRPLDDDTMAELNRQHSEDGLSARQVAETFLREQGLID